MVTSGRLAMWESRWSASTSGRPELLTDLLHGGALARLVRAQCREISSQGNLANKNSFYGVVSTDWCLVDFPLGLKRILVYAKLLWSRWSRTNPAPFCVLRQLLIVLPFFKDGPCSVDLV